MAEGGLHSPALGVRLRRSSLLLLICVDAGLWTLDVGRWTGLVGLLERTLLTLLRILSLIPLLL